MPLSPVSATQLPYPGAGASDRHSAAWGRFFEIARWALLAYIVIAGMIEYAFLRDHVSGGALVVLSLSLVVFAVHVPVLIGFTVARYETDDEPSVDGVPA